MSGACFGDFEITTRLVGNSDVRGCARMALILNHNFILGTSVACKTCLDNFVSLFCRNLLIKDLSGTNPLISLQAHTIKVTADRPARLLALKLTLRAGGEGRLSFVSAYDMLLGLCLLETRLEYFIHTGTASRL